MTNQNVGSEKVLLYLLQYMSLIVNNKLLIITFSLDSVNGLNLRLIRLVYHCLYKHPGPLRLLPGNCCIKM